MSDKKLHSSVCRAVELLNTSPEVAKCANARKAHSILREALVAYADGFMASPVSEIERSAVARKHRSRKGRK